MMNTVENENRGCLSGRDGVKCGVQNNVEPIKGFSVGLQLRLKNGRVCVLSLSQVPLECLDCQRILMCLLNGFEESLEGLSISGLQPTKGME